MSNQYLLSIVIPTRNRQFYALNAIKQIISLTSNNVQIVVQDNSDNNTLENLLHNLDGLNRIKYTYKKERIPGVENYGSGIKNSDGEYVCCIGDDDGITRLIEEYVKFAKDNNIDAIRYPNLAVYHWPGIFKKSKGIVSISKVSSNFSYFNPKVDLCKLLKNGAQNYLNLNLVKGYHGIVKKCFYDEIFKITGKYCGGLSPDIYLSVSLSFIVKKAINIYVPLTIGGICHESTSGDSINKINFGPFESMPHLIGQDYCWSDQVPKFYSATTIWADSAIHAFVDMKKGNMLCDYSIEKLLAECIVNFPQFKEEIVKCQINNKVSDISISNYEKDFRHTKTMFKIKQIVRRLIPNKFTLKIYSENGINDISEAEKVCFNYINGEIGKIVMSNYERK